jgi:hypothetical protein
MGHQGEFQNGSAEFTSFMEAGTFLGMKLARDLGSVAGDAFGMAQKTGGWSFDDILEIPARTVYQIPRSWDRFCERRNAESELGLFPSLPPWHSRGPSDYLIEDLGFWLPLTGGCLRELSYKRWTVDLIFGYDGESNSVRVGLGGSITF